MLGVATFFNIFDILAFLSIVVCGDVSVAAVVMDVCNAGWPAVFGSNKTPE